MRASLLSLLAAVGTAGLAVAQETPARGEIPLVVKVGEKASLCPCPVSGIICDDPSLVKIVAEPAGQSLEGVKPGATLCGLMGPNGVRRVYRVTVTAAKK